MIVLDRLAFRELSGRRPVISVAARTPLASGRVSANAAIVWRHFTTSVYQSGDLPVLATREALQNAVDAIRAAVRARRLPAGQGKFNVNWDGATHTLSWEDNGIGMDRETIAGKFLIIGESGKSGAADSEEAAGGFGVAKAVILGASRSFRWEIHSRDVIAVSTGPGADYQLFSETARQGTKITVFDVDPRFDTDYDRALTKTRTLEERIQDVLAANNLDGIELFFNDVPVGRMFSRQKGSKIADGGEWGDGTSAFVKGYKRKPGDRRGAFYIRLNGLFMFRAGSNNRNLPLDVVVDLTSTVRPGDQGYPLNAAREGLQGPAYWSFEELRRQIEQESESSARDDEAEILDPERSDTVAAATLAAFTDPDFRAAMEGAATGLVDYYAAMGPRSVSPPTSDAPAGSPPKTSPRLPVGGGVAEGSSAAAMVKTLLGEADAAVEAAGGERGTVLTEEIVEALSGGEKLPDKAVTAIQDAVTRANTAAIGPGGGGLLQVAATSRVHVALQHLAERPPAPPINPFGSLAGVRIAKAYDRKKASAFKRNFAKWLPHLTAWDATLRLITAEIGMKRRFYPGFLLDDEYGGMAAIGATGPVVYIHPDRFAEIIAAHKERPVTIASYLHGLACHELSHLDGRMAKGHGEEFVSAREAMQRTTAHLIEPLSTLIPRILSLPVRESPEQKLIRKLRSQLERQKGAQTELREKLRRAVEDLAAANLAASRAAARSSEATCPCRSAPPSKGQRPPDPGRWDEFAEVVAARLRADTNYMNAQRGDNGRVHHDIVLPKFLAEFVVTHPAHARLFFDDKLFSTWLCRRSFTRAVSKTDLEVVAPVGRRHALSAEKFLDLVIEQAAKRVQLSNRDVRAALGDPPPQLAALAARVNRLPWRGILTPALQPAWRGVPVIFRGRPAIVVRFVRGGLGAVIDFGDGVEQVSSDQLQLVPVEGSHG